jgi:hypothetical protein
MLVRNVELSILHCNTPYSHRHISKPREGARPTPGHYIQTNYYRLHCFRFARFSTLGQYPDLDLPLKCKQIHSCINCSCRG